MTLIHDFIYVPLAKDAVCRHLETYCCDWLGPVASDAIDDGERLLMRLGPFAGLATFGKTVEVNTASPVHHGQVTLVPITWHAVGTPHLFPVMTADLEVAPLGADLTQITLQGQYEPPLGAAGRGLDRLVLHHIAHATVRSFLHRVQTGLMAAEAANEPGREPRRPSLGFPGDLVMED